MIKDFHKFLKTNLIASQVPDFRFIGAVSTMLRFNEIEILTWSFGVYLFLIEDRIFFKKLKDKIGYSSQIYLKFRRADELVVSCAIFAKILNNYNEEIETTPNKGNFLLMHSQVDKDTQRLMKALNLDSELLIKMFN